MSLIYKYLIKAIPPSNNKFIGKNQRWQYQNEKKKWARIIQLFCVPRPLDGLVRSRIIEDDCFSCIDLKLVGNVDKDNPRTEILIEGE